MTRPSLNNNFLSKLWKKKEIVRYVRTYHNFHPVPEENQRLATNSKFNLSSQRNLKKGVVVPDDLVDVNSDDYVFSCCMARWSSCVDFKSSKNFDLIAGFLKSRKNNSIAGGKH